MCRQHRHWLGDYDKIKLGLTVKDIEAAIGEIPAALLPVKFQRFNELSRLTYTGLRVVWD